MSVLPNNRVTHFYGDGCDPPHIETYRCLSCYKDSAVGEWGERGMKCPLCGHVYDDHCVMQCIVSCDQTRAITRRIAADERPPSPGEMK